MKILFDYLPIALFFAVFKWAQSDPASSAQWASTYLGFLVSGGVVAPLIAPVLLATVTVVLATLAQVAWLLSTGRRVDTMLWISLGLVVVLGGATVYLQSEAFIKWKPTALWWTMAAVLALAQWVWRRNLLRSMLGQQLALPDGVWDRLLMAWVVFFVLMGAINWWVFTHYSTDTWVDFKLFGAMGLMFLFIIAQGVYISKHLPADADEASSDTDPNASSPEKKT